MEEKFHREKKTIELIETLVECIENWSKLCANGKIFYCGISLPYIYFYAFDRFSIFLFIQFVGIVFILRSGFRSIQGLEVVFLGFRVHFFRVFVFKGTFFQHLNLYFCQGSCEEPKDLLHLRSNSRKLQLEQVTASEPNAFTRPSSQRTHRVGSKSLKKTHQKILLEFALHQF